MGDITNNISYHELRPNGTPDTWMPEFPMQKLMLNILAQNIQLVINHFPNCHVTFASGVRTASDYLRLQQSGYNPSPISDHFCGNIVPIDKSLNYDYYKYFGPYYMFSVGAADTIPTTNIMDFFKLAVDLNKQGVTDFGQIIHETDPVKNTEWVHMSNNLNMFYSLRVTSILPPRPPYQYTTDGGKTYQIYNG